MLKGLSSHCVLSTTHTYKHWNAHTYTQEHKGIFGGDGYVKYFDCEDSVCICPNSSKCIW